MPFLVVEILIGLADYAISNKHEIDLYYDGSTTLNQRSELSRTHLSSSALRQ